MFFYMFAFMLTSVVCEFKISKNFTIKILLLSKVVFQVEQAFFIHKACKVDLNFPDKICENLTYHEQENKKVQVSSLI